MKNAEKKLKDNGSKLATPVGLQLLPLIMDNIPQAVFWKDQNLVYLGCNQAFAEDAGFAAPEEVIGKTDFDMPWKDQATLYRADDQQVLDRGKPKLNYEEPQTTPDGSTIWLRTSKIPVCENGRAVAILGMYEDITAHKQVELDLLLRDRALASSLNAVILLDMSDNKPIYANESLLKMTGYTFEEVKQLTLADITDSLTELPKIRAAVQSQGFFVGEESIKRKDGSTFPATFFTSLIKDSKGQPIAIQSSFFDVSEHKQAENLQQQNERLFRALFEMSPDAVTLIDPYDPSNEWPIVDCNTAACQINGYTREELIGQPINIVNAPTSTPIDREVYLKQLHEQGTIKYEIRHRRKDGIIFPVEVHTTLIKIGGRELLLGMDRDVTERKQVEEALKAHDEFSQRQSMIFAELTRSKNLYGGDIQAAFAEVTEASAKALNVQRASIWYYNDTRTEIHCMDLFEQGKGHSAGIVLTKADFPAYFSALEAEKVIAADNAHTDIATREFSASYLTPLGINSMLDAPIRLKGNVIGVICHEHVGHIRQWTMEEQNFARTIVDFITVAVETQEREQTEKALRESEDRFRRFTEATNEALIFHEQGKIVDVNPSALVMFGFAKEADVIGRNLLEFVEPEWHTLVLQKMQQEQVAPYEIQCIRTDGSAFSVETSTRGYKIGERFIRATSVRDVTERKQVEQTLRDSEARYSALVTQAKDGIVIIQDNILQFVNEAMADMLGYTVSEMTHTPIIDYIAPESRELIVNRIKARLAGQEVPTIYEAKLQHKDGTLIDAELSAGAIEYGGKPADAGMIRNISERKFADTELQREKSLSDAIINGLPGIFFLFDTQGQLIRWNKQYEQVVEYTTEEVAKLNALDSIADEDKERAASVIQHVFIEGQGSVEANVVTRHGKRIPYFFAGQRIQLGDKLYLAGTGIDITERKQAEQALQESQQFLRIVMDNIPQSIFWKDSNLTYLGCNSAFAADAALASPTDIVGKTDWDMPWKDQADLYRADDSLVMKNGVPKLNYEEPQTTPEGRTSWLRTSKIPLYDINGNAFAVLGMYEDITERKNMEEALHESEDRFRRFTEATAEGLVFHDRGKVVDVNPAVIAMMGATSAEDFIGKSLLEFILPEYHQLVLEKMKSETVLPYEIQCARKDGTVFPVETSTRAYKLGDREIRASSMRDITERKQAEMDLLLRDRALASSLNAVLVAGLDFRPIYANEAFLKMTGYTYEEAMRLTITDLSAYPEGLKRIDEATHTQGFFMGEEPIKRKDGSIFHTDFSTSYITDVKGQPIAIQTTFIDTTQRKQLEQEIQTELERRGRQVEISTQVSQSIAAASSLEELYERVVTQVKEQFGYYHTQLLRYDEVQEAVVLVTGYGEVGTQMLAAGHRMPMGEGLIGAAAATGETVLRPALENDPDWHPNPLLPETKGEIAVPIKLGNTVLGVLDVQSSVAGALDADDQLLLEGLCGQVATAIESTRLRQEMTERLEEINLLYRAMSHEGWQAYRERADVPSGFLYDQAGLRPAKEVDLTEELFANIPLTVPGGEVIGTLAVADDLQRPISPEDEAFLQQVSEQVALALESARLFEQTQSALVTVQESQAALDEAMNIAKLANWEYDVKRDRFLFNDHFYSIFHTTAEQVGGYEVSSARYAELFVHPDDGPMVGEEIGKALSSTDRHYNAKLEHRILFADGGVGYIAVNVHIERDEQGQIVRYYGANQDITDRKLAEEAIAKRASELETVAKLSATTSTVLDPDQLLQTVVDLTKERFGLYHAHIYVHEEAWNTLLLAAGAGEVGRKLVAEQHAIPVSLEQSLVARAARERQAIIINDVNNEPGFLPNPLLPQTCAEMAVPMTVGEKLLGVFDVQSNNPAGFSKEDANIYVTLASQVGVALQNARLYMEQAALVTQLRELDRLKSSFLANMSHELRTPLNSILGFADVIIEELDGPLTENMNNDLRLIQKNGQHLLHLINDVLDMAKIEAGRMNLSPENFKAFEVLEEVTSITSTLASEKNLSLFIEESSDRNVSIYADRTRLRQVMINLVNNAIKFTENGKIAIKLDAISGARILIAVKDTGIGIPPDKLEAIFQEFTQVDSSSTRKAGGTGLGLPISRRLVEMHGGRLWAESTGTPGEGSTFFVELPVEARITETIEKQAK